MTSGSSSRLDSERFLRALWVFLPPPQNNLSRLQFNLETGNEEPLRGYATATAIYSPIAWSSFKRLGCCASYLADHKKSLLLLRNNQTRTHERARKKVPTRVRMLLSPLACSFSSHALARLPLGSCFSCLAETNAMQTISPYFPRTE